MADEDCLICLTPKMVIKNTETVFFFKKDGIKSFFQMYMYGSLSRRVYDKMVKYKPSMSNL